MLKVFLLVAALASPLAAQSRIVNCPHNGRPYSTVHGYYVDVPGTTQYVPPSRRVTRPTRSTRSTRRYN